MAPKRSARVPAEDLLAEVDWLRALARRLARDHASAEDLAQGTLTAALEHPPARERPLRPWLATVLRNLARATRRADARRRDREAGVVPDARRAAPSGHDVLAEFEEQRRLVELIARLDERDRVVLLRHFYQGESAARIARSNGQPSATVRSRIARALTRLRELHVQGHRGDSRRSLSALAVAAGRGGMAPWIPLAATSLTSLFAMKTMTKAAAAATVVVLLLAGGREAYRAVRATEPEKQAAVTPEIVPADEGASDPLRAGQPGGDAERQALAPPVEVAAPAPAVEQVARTGLSLRAVDEFGNPIRGARIVLITRGGVEHDLAPSERSGSDGRVEVDVDRTATFRYVGDESRLAPIRLEAPGFGSTFSVERIVEDSITELGDRELLPGSDVSGRVLDPEGYGVPGVEVVAVFVQAEGATPVFYSGGEGPIPDEPYVRTTSGARGEFALSGLELRPYTLWFRVPGLRWNKSDPIALTAGEILRDVELVLSAVDPSMLITGRVFLPDGSPAPSARVRVRTADWWGEYEIELDDAGRFVHQPGTSETLLFMAEDPSEDYSPSVTVAGAAGGPELRLDLHPARRCRVHVTDEQGDPIERAWMMAEVDGAMIGPNWTYTDAEGAASLLMPGEPFQLRVGCTGYEAVYEGPLDPLAVPEVIEVALVREPELRGIVLADGEPVPGATVHLARAWEEGRRTIYMGFTSRFFGNEDPVTTDADGRFHVPLAEPEGKSWSLLVEKEGFARTEHAIGMITAAEDVPEITVRLNSGGTLEGRVLVAPTTSREGIVIAASREDGLPLITRTDADGDFRFEHLTPGGWLIEGRDVAPEGRSMSMGSKDGMPFVPNAVILEGATTSLDLDLTWKDDLALHGRLSFDGRGAEGWTAVLDPGHALENPRTFPPVVLDAHGNFSAPATPGPAQLILHSPDGAAVTRVVDVRVFVGPHTAPVELDLATGAVRGAGREPGASMRTFCRLRDDVVTIHEFVADEDGAYAVDGIPAAEVSVQWDTGRGWETVGKPTIHPGQTATID